MSHSVEKVFAIVLLLPASMFMGRVSIFHCMGWKLMSDIVCKPSVSWKLLLKVFFLQGHCTSHINKLKIVKHEDFSVLS